MRKQKEQEKEEVKVVDSKDINKEVDNKEMDNEEMDNEEMDNKEVNNDNVIRNGRRAKKSKINDDINTKYKKNVGHKKNLGDKKNVGHKNNTTAETISKSNPYEVLGVNRTSTKEEIQKAFIKLRIKYHPDRKTGDRIMYDKVVEAYKQIQYEVPYQYIEVDAFIRNYKDSDEEINDLISLYIQFKGDLTKIMNHHILTEEEDEERIRKILDKEIKNKRVKEYKKYNQQILKKNKNVTKAEQLALEMGIDINQSLEEILNRSVKREKKFLEDLETKYCRRLE